MRVKIGITAADLGRLDKKRLLEILGISGNTLGAWHRKGLPRAGDIYKLAKVINWRLWKFGAEVRGGSIRLKTIENEYVRLREIRIQIDRLRAARRRRKLQQHS